MRRLGNLKAILFQGERLGFVYYLGLEYFDSCFEAGFDFERFQQDPTCHSLKDLHQLILFNAFVAVHSLQN